MSPNPLLPLNTLKPPLPPVDTGGDVESQKTEQPQSSETNRDRETRHGFKAPWRWVDRRPDIEKVGEALGLGRWDEAAWNRWVGPIDSCKRAGESFERYAARVKKAYDAQADAAREASLRVTLKSVTRGMTVAFSKRSCSAHVEDPTVPKSMRVVV